MPCSLQSPPQTPARRTLAARRGASATGCGTPAPALRKAQSLVLLGSHAVVPAEYLTAVKAEGGGERQPTPAQRPTIYLEERHRPADA